MRAAHTQNAKRRETNRRRGSFAHTLSLVRTGSSAGLPPASMRSVYGFVLHVFAVISSAVYLAWLLIPDDVLDGAGFTYRPQK